jgi:Flp pilus assembly pilin Flp
MRLSRRLRARLRRANGGGGERAEAGAAAVEFALVLPILVLILFGIIDYGLYFNTSLQARWGVHDAARAAVVAPSAGGTTSCGATVSNAPPPDIMRLICAVTSSTGSATAKKYIDVQLPAGWQVGSPLIVCERLDATGVTGYVPLPRRGQIRDVAVLEIEQPDLDPLWPPAEQVVPDQDYAETLPNGDWSWCTPGAAP